MFVRKQPNSTPVRFIVTPSTKPHHQIDNSCTFFQPPLEDEKIETFDEAASGLNLPMSAEDTNFLNSDFDSQPLQPEVKIYTDDKVQDRSVKEASMNHLIETKDRDPNLPINNSVSYPDQSPSQDEAKPGEGRIEIEEEGFKQTEKLLFRQGEDQQNLISSTEDQRSTKSTNALTTGSQVEKDYDFIEGASTSAHLCRNKDEQGESQIINHHTQVEEEKINGGMATWRPDYPSHWKRPDQLNSIFKPDWVQLDQNVEANRLQYSKQIQRKEKDVINIEPSQNRKRGHQRTKQSFSFEKDFVQERMANFSNPHTKSPEVLENFLNRTTLGTGGTLTVPGLPQKEENEQNRIEIEEEDKARQGENFESEPEKNLENIIPNTRNQRFSNSTNLSASEIRTTKDPILKERMSFSGRNQQENNVSKIHFQGEEKVRNKNMKVGRSQRKPASGFCDGGNNHQNKDFKAKEPNLPQNNQLKEYARNRRNSNPERQIKRRDRKPEEKMPLEDWDHFIEDGALSLFEEHFDLKEEVNRADGKCEGNHIIAQNSLESS